MAKRKIQRTSNEGCWQFLDCEILTGIPANKCPNAESCKNNALESHFSPLLTSDRLFFSDFP
jgi:hypothetical protein